MPNVPTVNHGEGNPEAATRFNDAAMQFVKSARGLAKIDAGCKVLPQEEAELNEAERLGKARAKGDAPATSA
jgi:hypothetical protein